MFAGLAHCCWTLAVRLTFPWLFAAEEAEPAALKLDPVVRAQVLMVLLGLLLLGLLLVLLVLAGGRYVRRLARHRPQSQATPADDWYRKPLVSAEPPPDEEA